MAANSIKEIAIELNENYREALELKKEVGFEKKEKSIMFNNILKMLFAQYGSSFGYNDLSAFKSDVVFVQQKIKKEREEKRKEASLHYPIHTSLPVFPMKKQPPRNYGKDSQLELNFGF